MARWNADHPAGYRRNLRKHKKYLRNRAAKLRGLIMWELLRRLKNLKADAKAALQFALL